MSIIFLVFMTMLGLYSRFLVTQINEQWGTRLAEKQVLFDKHRTLQPLLREISLARKLAAEPAIIQMALHEEDLTAHQRGLAVLEQYRLRFQDRSYFAAMVKSNHYYFNDAANQFGGQQLRYTLAHGKSDDAWFFATVANKQIYQVNVDPDAHLGNVKVWINVAVKNGEETVAIIGTGIDIGDFLKDTVDVAQAGIHNLFIDRDMAVQLHSDKSLIDYASLTKSVEQRRKVDVLLTAPGDLTHLRSVMQRLESAPNQVETLWVQHEGKKVLLGVAYLPEVGWFDLTLMGDSSLNLLQRINFIPIFAMLFLLGLIAVSLVLHRQVLKPLHQMGQSIEQIKEGNYEIDVPLVGSGEIAQLSEQFKNMIKVVRTTKLDLESKVTQRTEELSRELSERKRAELELRRSETVLRTLYNTTSDAIMLLTDKGFFNCNRATLELFGIATYEEFYTKHPADLSPALQPNGVDSVLLSNKHIADAMAEGSLHFEWMHQRADNHQKFPADVLFNAMNLDGATVIQAVVRNITARKKAEDQIRQLAYYDTLTRLPNRLMLNDRLKLAIAASKRSACYGALMFIDLDNFKPLNDTHGHAVGDLLLIEAANRLTNCVREVDTVARFGGDEFVVMLSDLETDKTASVTQAHIVAEKIRTALSEPYLLTIKQEEKTDITVRHLCTASIGFVVFLNHECSQDDILKWADAAMYQAKEAGRNSIRFYDWNA
jgi:diguanylate cyclase (GGDEF)-like protein/PAS domain S-box-containing protein